MSGLFANMKRFDAYPKMLEDYQVKTFHGATISIVAMVFMVLLIFSEFSAYLTVVTTNQLVVDVSSGEKLRINIDISFPHLSCALLSADVMDVSGEQHLDVEDHHLFKRRIDKQGNDIEQSERHHIPPVEQRTQIDIEHGRQKDEAAKAGVQLLPKDDPKSGQYCGSCYGAGDSETSCCNSCNEVREAYRKRGWAFQNSDHIVQCTREGFNDELKRQGTEGCRMHGYLEVNKVAGNFHFAPGKSFQQAHMHVHDLMNFNTNDFNVSHIVHHLSFGEKFPGVVNPLDNTQRHPDIGSGMFQYFVKIVPTTYSYISGSVLSTNQYAVTQYFRPLDQSAGRGLPGVFIFYDMSPIMVKFEESHRSLAHFLTSVCAVVGGVFTVSGLLDSIIYRGVKSFAEKKGT